MSPTISSPSLTGTPTAPTPATITNNTQIATTAFVNNLITSTSINSSQISGTIATDLASATSSSTANTIVKRDANSNFSANIITATLAGNASTSTQLATARSIYGNNFDGSAALTSAIAGQYGGTGVVNTGKTITLGGNIVTASDFATSGSFSTTLVSTAPTNITLPITGTLATLSGTETLTSKTIVSPTISSPSLTGTPTAPTPATITNNTQIATTAFVNNLITSTSINSSQISGTIATDLASATSSSTANTIVKRDANSNFSANIITATLAGNASTSTQLATARSIYGNNFNGGADLTAAIIGQYGGTGVNNGTKTISLGGNISTTADFITSGNYSTTLTSTGVTNVTLPTSGIIATIAGDFGGTAILPRVNTVGGVNSSTITTIASAIASATSTNTASTLVQRDVSGNFSAGIITATLAGNASTSTQLATARSIYGNNFNGGADLTSAITGQYGGTGVNNGTKTISLGGNISTTADFITAGNFSTTLTSTGTTNVTLPITGTLSTLAGTETLTNKTIASPALTGTPTSTTADVADNTTQVATTAFVRSRIATDTASLSNRINSLTNTLTGTGSGTTGYLKIADTSSMLTNRIQRDTSFLIQKTSMASILTNYTATLSSAKTFIDKNDTSTMMQRRYNSDVVPVMDRVTVIEGSRITLGSTSMALAGTYTSVTGLSSVTSSSFVGTLSGTADNATKLTTARNINGIPFDGTANITIGADAGTLTGTSLASTITGSSLTSVGTITSGVWSGTVIGSNKGGAGSVNGIMKANGTGIVSAAISGTDYQTPITIGTTNMAAGGTFTSVAGLSSVTSTNFVGTLSGTASTANKLTITKNINGVAFDGSTDITVTADANTLTGTTLNATVVNSSLTSVGTIISGVWSGTTLAVAKGGTGLTTTPANGQIDIGNGTGFTRATLTPGSGISISNGAGTITITASGLTSSNLSATAGITNAQLLNSTTTLGSTSMALGGTYTSITGLSSLTSTSLVGTLSGTASTADKLTASKTINGVAFDGSANITVTADANTLTGTTLKSTVTSSSLTGVGTITSGVWNGITLAVAYGGTGLTAAPTNGQINIGTGSGTFTTTNLTAGSGISIANGSGSIGITALAGTISGTTLASNVVSSSLTGVGTITSGTWSGTTISVANGGTGTISLTGVIKGNGNSAFTAATEGTDYSYVREYNDETAVTTSQYTTSNSVTLIAGTDVVSAVFTLTYTPNAKSLVKVYVNGIRISKNAYRYNTSTDVATGTSSATPTKFIAYIPDKNGNYKLSTGDRIQIDYYW